MNDMVAYWRSAYQKKHNNKWQWLLLSLTVLAVLFFLGQNLRVYLRKIEYRQDLINVQSEVSSLESQERQLEFQTDAMDEEIFLERLARERLNLRKPGEQVIVFEIEEENQDNLTNQGENNFWIKTASSIKEWFRRQ